MFMALIAVLIMPTQTLQVQHEDYLPDCHKYNYIGNLTREMAVDYTDDDFTINVMVNGNSTFVTPEQEVQLSLNAILSNFIDWLMYDTGAATHVCPKDYATDYPLLPLD